MQAKRARFAQRHTLGKDNTNYNNETHRLHGLLYPGVKQVPVLVQHQVVGVAVELLEAQRRGVLVVDLPDSRTAKGEKNTHAHKNNTTTLL